MNSTEQSLPRPVSLRRLIKWPLFCLWLALALCRPASGADGYYINNAIVDYPQINQYPPVIDATNFVNNNSFTINFRTITADHQFYETSDTLNYTNIGSMVVNTGFKFDNQSTSTGLRYMSSSFYNPGSVSCGSVNNLGDPFGGLLGTFGLLLPQCVVNATNIVNPGSVNVGVDGMILFTGRNVDLTRGSLNMEGSGANAFGSGIASGLNTNYWDPSLFLGATFAESAFIPMAPFYLYLPNSTAYMTPPRAGPTNPIITAVFIEDNSVSNASYYVSYKVYIDTRSSQFGFVNTTIEWTGSYLDPASGEYFKNYLYLDDDTGFGTETNNFLTGNGFPANFTFRASPTPRFLGVPPATPQFNPNVFSIGSISNRYSFMDAQLISTTVPTNSVANYALTNLPGRIQIAGTNELNLAFSEITGPNYMAIRSTNQFDGSAGASIQSPYSDIYVGVTNGILNITNLMSVQVPNWGGIVQAWTTRWTDINPNTGGTNEYRVLIVGSQLTPTTLAQVQDLVLHGTNSITISDTFNVMRTFSADARSLTLTTNTIGNGSTSFDGELNLESPAIFWQSSVPNLRFLTNNGAIRMQNLAYFGTPLLTNVVGLVPATGTLSETGTNVVKNDKVTIGSSQYTFVATLTNTVANQVKIVPTSFDASISNLIAAINAGGGAGTGYSTATKSNSSAMAGQLTGHAFTVTARTGGTAGNSISTVFTPATASVNLSWGGHATLFGGAGVTTNVVPFLYNNAFINNGIFTDQGSILYAGNFVSSGLFSNGIGSFTLQSLTTTLTNGSLFASGDVSIMASSLVTSNLVLEADRSLTLTVTNLLTDTGPNPTNLCFWMVGSNSAGSGFNLPIKPATGDLLGTAVTLIAPTNRNVASLWAGMNRGLSVTGFSNNMAVGQFIMDAKPSFIAGHNGKLTFNGTGSSNALYIDQLILEEYSTSGNATNSYNFPWLQINTNMMIYYAQATESGVSVAEAIDRVSRQGGNSGGRLRWIYSYAGYYSSTNLTYTNLDGSIGTNTVNAALAQSTTIDSDSDGRPNGSDPTPFFNPPELQFTLTLTNLPPNSARVQWTTIPNATNFVYYSTNLQATNWLAFTNFKNWYYGNNVAVTNATHGNSFRSPQIYVNNASLPDNSQRTNVWVFDAITNVPHYYKVVVWPWLSFPE